MQKRLPVILLFFLLFFGFTASSLPAQLTLPFKVDSIPMRDGKKLAADVYLPDTTAGTYPTILVQTPYNRTLLRFWLPLIGRDLANSPYAFVILDWRGFYGSAGALSATARRGEDGYDAVEWIAAQSWSDGKVGTWGPSALGGVQYQTAREDPPHLTCCVPLVAGTQFEYQLYYPGGCIRTEYVEQLDLLGFGLGALLYANPTRNLTWIIAEAGSHYPQDLKVPMFLIGGWYDHNDRLMLEVMDSLLKASPAANQMKLLYGPWVHGGNSTASVGTAQQGELSYPGAAGANDSMALRFFEHYLLGTQNGWPQTAAYTWWLMGTDRWFETAVWPPAGVTDMPYYLQPGNRLTTTMPGTGPDSASWNYDPRDPSPTVGGPTLRGDLVQGPYDQRPLVESRNDIAIFTTPVLTAPVTITGRPKVRLFVSSDRYDTDVAVRLTDVYPDSRSMLVKDGIFRMRYLNSFSNPDSLVPGQVYEVEIELYDVAQTFQTGHQIRLAITSSNYPRFDANMNDGDTLYVAGDSLVARNTVYFDAARPSRLILPVNSTITGVAGLQEQSSTRIEIWPHPVTDAFQFSFSGKQARHYQIDVLDLQGRTVRQLGNAFKADRSYQLEAINLKPGYYFLRVRSGQGIHAVRKLLVQQ